MQGHKGEANHSIGQEHPGKTTLIKGGAVSQVSVPFTTAKSKASQSEESRC